MANTQSFAAFPIIADFTPKDNSIKGQVERVKAIHNDANACLDVLKSNVKKYVDYAVNVFDCIINGIIVNLSDSAFVMLEGSFRFIVTQFNYLYHRYDTIDDNGYVDAYVRCELKNIDFENALGIYNKERNGNNPEVIKEDAKFIAAAKTACEAVPDTNDERIKEMAAMKAFYDALSAPENDVRGVLNKKENTNPTTQEKANTGRFTLVKSNTKFKDIAGLHEVKEDLEQYIDMIKRPDVYVQYGAKLPKGILLYGPPGTGKTLLARGVAGEAGVNFIALSSTDFTASRWGEVPQMIKELQEVAVKNKPCIVFIDEIDMLGMNRGADKANSLAHREGLNAFLSMLDGFETYEGVMFIAATNRLEDIDPAMIRGGRFENQFSVPLPLNLSETQEVVEIYMRNKHFAEDLDARKIAHKFLGYSPANIEAVMNEACLLAIRKNNGVIRDQDLNDAIIRKAVKGHVRSNQDTDMEDKKIVSVHEAGHALVAVACDVPVQSVSIIGTTSGAGGLTMMNPQSKHFMRKSDYENQIMISYGGRVAEQLVFGKDLITTGASQDLKQATKLIQYAGGNFGFDLFDKNNSPIVYKTVSQSNIEKAANKYYQATIDIINNNAAALGDIVKELILNGCISGEIVKEIYENNKKNKETNVADIEIN